MTSEDDPLSQLTKIFQLTAKISQTRNEYEEKIAELEADIAKKKEHLKRLEALESPVCLFGPEQKTIVSYLYTHQL